MNAVTTQAIDTGDTVRHTPTGEDWLVAYVANELLCACGWPCTLVPINECTLTEKATQEEKQKLLQQLAAMSGDDPRRAYARRVLAADAGTAAQEPAGAAAQTPMFFASAGQANALQDRPGDNEGGVYLPLRKTAAGKFTMPLYAAPVAALAAREQETVSIELRGIAETLENQDGHWRSCSGCHELNEGHDTGLYSAVLKCHLGSGCSECGGIGAIWDTTDYADMAAHALASRQQAPAASDAPACTCCGCSGCKTCLSGRSHCPKHSAAPSEALSPATVTQPVALGGSYLCRAWGETDLPVAEIALDLDGVRRFMVREWWGEEAPSEYDSDENMADRIMAEIEGQDWRDDPKWSAEFEIGGVSVERVFGMAAQPCASQGSGADGGDDILQFAPKLPGVSGPERTLERIIQYYYIEHIDDEGDALHLARLYSDALRAALSTDKGSGANHG